MTPDNLEVPRYTLTSFPSLPIDWYAGHITMSEYRRLKLLRLVLVLVLRCRRYQMQLANYGIEVDRP